MTTHVGILLVAGPPCSGKSTLARALCASGGQTHVSVDRIFDTLFPASDRNRHDRLLGYDTAHAAAQVLVDAAREVVLECTYTRADQRASLARLLAPSVPVRIAEVAVSADVAVARFLGRDEGTDLDEAGVRERVSSYPFSGLGLRLDGAQPTARLLTAAEAWLSAAPDPVDREAWVSRGRA